MNQSEFFKQLKVTVELLGFGYRDRKTGSVFILKSVLNTAYMRIHIEQVTGLYVLDTLYAENRSLGLPRGVAEYTLDQLPELLYVISQYLVSILEASKKQNKPI